ncbi:hypothetical protein [Flavobacterium wongokense]|uniref:hypothetical protein n=1 Tax=Flavobacterium wongokense TaxID=2910674 RepID=UPI001F19DA4E|nr:hypothetical protein [Flavobacterium sp. WG47]MCF6133363.1 hypothetical protein [Flavobacterium sp. WG47]
MFRMLINNDKNTVKAFSVLEAAFSMVITAIVIGLVFVVFTILSERMLDFKKQNQFVADMNRLTYALNKDIFDNEAMAVNEEGIMFTGYSGNKVRYLRNEEYTIREKDGFLDTFQIPMKNFIVDTLQNKSKKVTFQRLRINIDVNKQPMDLRFFKKVYANQLIEKEK